MAPEKKLSVQLLGQPLITWGGQTLTIPRKQARLILYFLACHKDMVSREDITLIFWPDSPNPRQQLRDHLSKLRAELPDLKILKTDRDWISFNFDYVHSDVLTFEDNYNQVSLPFLTNEKRPLPEAIYQKMLAAVNMWKSPHFMHGIGVLESEDLNEWIADKNRKLRIKWLSLMMRIAQHLMIIGDLEGALEWLEKVSEHDEDYLFPQVIYLRLEVLYQLGQLTRAYEFGQKYLEQIDTDWFAEYKLPFEALLQKIESDRAVSSSHELPPTRTANGMMIPLMGHKEVLNEMLRAFHRGNIIFLTGETGMGKTRLMHEFVNRLAVPLSVLSMEAVYTERDIPFHPFIEMLRRSMNMNEWQKVENFWLAQLVPFFPELQNMVDRRFEVIGVIENKRLSLYESFRQVFLALIGQNKVLISLENAQWMDEESARLLGYLAKRQFFIKNAHLVMLTNQDEARSFGIDYRENPIWASQVTWIKIPPLTLDDVSNIGLYLVRTPIKEKHAQQLLDATGGNPLFVIETLQMILEKPDELAKEEWKRIPLPGVVHLVLRERLLHISEDAKKVLWCAAVVGVDFYFDYMQVMLDLPELELVNAIDELIEKDFIALISASQQPLQYRFKLTLLRDVILEEISRTEKQILHRRLATHLLEYVTKDPNAEKMADAAYHLSQAGKGQEAFSYWIQAANLFSNADDLIKANSAYKNALQLSQNRNFEITDQQLYDLWIGWGEMAVVENDFQKANEYYQRGLQEGLMRNSQMLIGSGLSGMGYLFLNRGLPNQARQYLDRALIYLKEGPVLEYIRANIRKMLVSLYHFNLDEGEACFESFAWLENQLKQPKEFIAFSNARNTLALIKVLLGKFDEVETLIEKSNQVASKYKNWTLRMRNEFALGLGYYFQGKNPQALEHMGIALNIAENNYIWQFVLETLSVTSHIHLAMGKTYLCYESIQNAYNLAKAYQYTSMHSVLISAEGKLHFVFGDYQHAIQLFEEGVKFSNNDRNMVTNQIWKVFSQACLGQYESGITLLEQIRTEALNKQWIQTWIEASSHLGKIHYLAGNTETALQILDEVRQKATPLGFAGAGTGYAYVQAKSALQQGDHKLAIENGLFILEKAKNESSLWLEWLALDILLAAEMDGGENIANYKAQLKNVVRNLNQSKPHWMDFDLNSKKPSLFGLV